MFNKKLLTKAVVPHIKNMAHQDGGNAGAPPPSATNQGVPRGTGTEVPGLAASNRRPDPMEDKPPSRVEEGFTTVSRTRSGRRGPNNAGPGRQGGPTWTRNITQSNRGGKPPGVRPPGFSHMPPSAAASSRASQYARQTSSGFDYMKQSALPVDERDPVLYQIEQNKGRKVPKSVYRQGMIFRAIHHEPYFEGVAGVNDKARTESIYGGIHSKYRKMIVVALYEEHCVAIPLYTHNGNGLAGISKPDEYVSVRDHRSKDDFVTLSRHEALITGNLNEGIEPYEPKSVAHLTYPVSRRYASSIVLEGHLSKTSTKALLRLYLQYIPKTLDPPVR